MVDSFARGRVDVRLPSVMPQHSWWRSWLMINPPKTSVGARRQMGVVLSMQCSAVQENVSPQRIEHPDNVKEQQMRRLFKSLNVLQHARVACPQPKDVRQSNSCRTGGDDNFSSTLQLTLVTL